MNKLLEKVNLIGVLALAVLCVAQWKINRATNLELHSAQKKHQEQASTIEENKKTIAGNLADLESFRVQLTSVTKSEKELSAKNRDLELKERDLTLENEALKSAITNWAAAVETRDQQLRQAATNIQSVAQSRDEAIDKYNELAKRHNQLVAEVNQSRTNTVANSAQK
jgi:hypothetical protein